MPSSNTSGSTTATFTSGLTQQTTFVNVGSSNMQVGSENDFWAHDVDALDIRYGGQFGLLPRIGGENGTKAIQEWMYAQAYQRMDLIPIVLQTPKMFDLFPQAKGWHEAVKAMFEVHAKTIDGLNASLTVNTGEHNTGMSGAVIKEITQVTREATNVSIGLNEKNGIPFETLLDVWIRYGLDDPDIGHPLITRIADSTRLPKHWTAEWYTCTVLFIEPDRLRRRAIHAWLVSNLFPTSNPDIIGKKDKTAARELKQMTIDFGGFALPPTSKKVKDLANTVMGIIKPWEKDPEDILLPANNVMAGLLNVEDKDIYYEGTRKATTNSKTETTAGTDEVTGIKLSGKK